MKNSIIVDLAHAQATKKLGKKIAESLNHKPCLIFLEGDLGAGKTTLAQGFIQALTNETSITSPTYAYMHTYQGYCPIYHFDLYRAQHLEDIFALGLIEFIHNESAIRLIEWPERLFDTIEPEITIELKKIGSTRQAIISTTHLPLSLA